MTRQVDGPIVVVPPGEREQIHDDLSDALNYAFRSNQEMFRTPVQALLSPIQRIRWSQQQNPELWPGSSEEPASEAETWFRERTTEET